MGALTGFLGVGGGNIIVPSLVGLGYPAKKAAASSAFVVIFASLSGFASHATMAGINYPLLALTATGSATGAAVAARLMIDRLKPVRSN